MGNKEEPENQEIETSNNVKEEDVPDYLKEEYGLDKKQRCYYGQLEA